MSAPKLAKTSNTLKKIAVSCENWVVQKDYQQSKTDHVKDI